MCASSSPASKRAPHCLVRTATCCSVSRPSPSRPTSQRVRSFANVPPIRPTRSPGRAPRPLHLALPSSLLSLRTDDPISLVLSSPPPPSHCRSFLFFTSDIAISTTTSPFAYLPPLVFLLAPLPHQPAADRWLDRLAPSRSLMPFSPPSHLSDAVRVLPAMIALPALVLLELHVQVHHSLASRFLFLPSSSPLLYARVLHSRPAFASPSLSVLSSPRILLAVVAFVTPFRLALVAFESHTRVPRPSALARTAPASTRMTSLVPLSAAVVPLFPLLSSAVAALGVPPLCSTSNLSGLPPCTEASQHCLRNCLVVHLSPTFTITPLRVHRRVSPKAFEPTPTTVAFPPF